MKNRFVAVLLFFVVFFALTACDGASAVPKFLGTPSAVTGDTTGTIILNAEVDGSGKIFYLVVPKNASAPSASQIQAGIAYGSVVVAHAGDSGSTSKITNLTITLTKGVEYSVYFVIKEGDSFSSVHKVDVAAKEELVLGFSAMAVSSGDDDGEIRVNIAKSSEVGTIYFILVYEGSVAPTVAQIMAGQDYGDVTVIANESASAFTNFVIDELTPGERYTLYTVITYQGVFSVVRNMTAAAKETIEIVDKGEGTEENPFQISTIEDLLQIGQGYYASDDKEWNMENHYILMNDIDLSVAYGPELADWPVLGFDAAGQRFAGVLDGDGFAIIGLYVGPDSTAGAYRGLFASAEPTSVVKNLSLIDFYVRGAGIGEENSNHGTGTLFGYFKGTVMNVSVINAVVEDSGTRVGGLGGRSYETGHVYNTYVNAVVSGFNRVGGFVGVVDVADGTPSPIIYENVVFDGRVIGETQHIGGLVGYLRGAQISNVFVTGYIQGAQEVGGVAGFYQKRGGNNTVSAMIENATVFATVYGSSTSTTIGAIVGQKSTTGINQDNEQLLQARNNYHVEGTRVVGGGDVRSINGEVVLTSDFGSLTWFETNLPAWDFIADWEFKTGAERPTLIGSPDEGLLSELVTPLVLISTIEAGVEEKSLSVRIVANKPDTIIYVIVVEQGAIAPSIAELKDPTSYAGTLFSGFGNVIDDIYTMSQFNTYYDVYFFAEHADGDADIEKVSARSKAMTELIIAGGLRPGNDSRELDVTLTTNLPATIYYVLVDSPTTWTKEQIKSASGVLFSGQGTSIDLTHVMPLEGTVYYLYAFAEAADRESAIFAESGLSNSDDFINYGTGTAVDPFIVRTVEDFDNIGNPSYLNSEGVALNYSNSAHYILENNIDLTEKYGEGKLNWAIIPIFSGTIDGAGFTVKGLYIDAPSFIGHTGMIGELRAGGMIKNITFEDSYINVAGNPSDGTTAMVGTVAGRMISSSAENVNLINAIVMTQGYRVGGFAGGIEGTDNHISNIYVEAEVTGLARVGGMFGNAINSSLNPLKVENVVFIGSVTALGTSDFRVGGIIGWGRGIAIENAFVDAVVYGNLGIAGGVAGYLENYNDQTQFSTVTNALLNVLVISDGSNRAGTVIGSISSDPNKIPTVINVYQTSESHTVTTGSVRTDIRNGIAVDQALIDETWITTNMAGFSIENGWHLMGGASRPSLVNTPDEGLIRVIELPLIVVAKATTGNNEKEIDVAISTNKSLATIYVAISSGGVFSAQEIIDANISEIFFAVFSGTEIDETFLMPAFDTQYVVHYVIVDGDTTSEIQEIFVTSAEEKQLMVNVSAQTGEVDPGDIELELVSTSHDALVYIAVLSPSDSVPTPSEIKAMNQILDGFEVRPLVPGEAYIVYVYGEKISGNLHSEVEAIEVVAKASLEADFEWITTDLVANEASGELRLTLQTSHLATIYYLVVLSDAPAVDKTTLLSEGIVLSESPTVLQLLAGTEYTVYILAERADSSDELLTHLTATSKRALFNGEEDSSYYPIYALEDIEAYRDGVNDGSISRTSTLEFKADLDLSLTYGEMSAHWFPIGTNANKYKGEVIGNNHVINGLYINYNNPNNNEGVGFFGTTDTGFVLQNLHFTNVNVTGNFSVGAVVGYAKADHMSNVSVVGGTVTGLGADTRVGGLIGRLNSNRSEGSIIEFVFTDVTVLGVKSVGGLVGHVDYTSDTIAGELIIRDVYTLGTTTGTAASNTQVGGVVGYLRATIIRGVAYGNIEGGTSEVGGVVGYIQYRSATNIPATVTYSIAANDAILIGRIQPDRGEPILTGNVSFIENDPAAVEQSLQDLLNTINWGVTIPLDQTNWEVINDKAVLKQR